jgi:anti-anti-sigma regulatory factor
MDLAVEALNHEATDFINKPISRSALTAALHRAEERLNAAMSQVPVAELLKEDGIQVIDILGNVNAKAEEQLMAVYGGAGEGTRILLNFRENTAINGAGIAVLIGLLTESKKKNQTVAIAGISENLQEIFRMVGITRFAGVFAGRAEAKGSLARPAGA